MNLYASQTVASTPKLLLNAGCGAKGSGRVPQFFNNWQQFRIDLDSSVEPDLIADITDLAGVPDGCADALWTAHCVEHLYQHQVPLAFAAFQRVLKDDGFACIVVPDLQTIAGYIANDQLQDVLYQSPAGPITPHDVVFGFGTAISKGFTGMAHRCGFTPTSLVQSLSISRFADFVIRRKPASFELVVVARKTPWQKPSDRDMLLEQIAA